MAEFFTEVDEELRQERAAALFKRLWPYVAGALAFALAVTLAWWGWSSWNRAQDAKAGAAYARALELLSQGKLDQAEKGFAEAARTGSSGYRALSLMQQAGVHMTRGQPAQAVPLLDKAAATAREPIIADAAALQAAFALMDTAPPAQTAARLQPLTGAGRPYRDMAREALALSKLAHGQAKEARADLSALSIQPDVSEAARNRARAAVALIDSGGGASIPAGLKAELALPPAPFVPPAAALAAPGAQ